MSHFTDELLDSYLYEALANLTSALANELTQRVLGLPMESVGQRFIDSANRKIDDYNSLIEWARQYEPERFTYRMF